MPGGVARRRAARWGPCRCQRECVPAQVVIGTPTGIFATFVLTVVASEDSSRVLWPSCPATGWAHGVNTLSSLPNGSPSGLIPQGSLPAPIETHGPYSGEFCVFVCMCVCMCVCVCGGGGAWVHIHVFEECERTGAVGVGAGPYIDGSGFPCVNGGSGLAPFDPNIPITVSTAPTGVCERDSAPTLTPSRVGLGLGLPNVYASEFGVSVFSSFESMSPTLDPSHWGIHAVRGSRSLETKAC